MTDMGSGKTENGNRANYQALNERQRNRKKIERQISPPFRYAVGGEMLPTLATSSLHLFFTSSPYG
jgi:hypothetical protein